MIDMILFPKVIKQICQDNKAVLDLFIEDNVFYFKGHFPDNPILPGITQVHWAVHYVKEFFNLACVIKGAPAVKFTNLIQPNKTIRLELELFKDQHYFTYAYLDDDTIYSSGKLSYILGDDDGV